MKRRKKRFEITEEFKKKLLSKVFKYGYSKVPDYAFMEKYCGYNGIFPLEVEFYGSIVFVTRLGRLKKGEPSNKAMTEIANDIFGVEDLEIDKIYTMDFEGVEMKLDFDYKCISLKFFEKEKEVAA